jgi:hypothetical protein
MNNLVIKRNSPIHGIGIFTNKGIESRVIFYEVPTSLISGEPKTRLAHIDEDKWVCDEDVLNYVNHSCEPNAILDITDRPKLVAKRDIMPREEITVDYDLTEKGGRKVPCTCGCEKCKGYFLRIE